MILFLFESAMKDTLGGDWCFSWCFSWVLFSFSIRFSRMLFLCVSSSVVVLCFVVMLSVSFFSVAMVDFSVVMVDVSWSRAVLSFLISSVSFLISVSFCFFWDFNGLF